jgi:uncharacterized membrane protein YjjB (DUF3815 family)
MAPTMQKLILETLLLQSAMGFLTTFGFAILFNVPRRTLLSVSVVGAAGHLIRHLLSRVGVSAEVAAFSGAFVVGVVGYWLAMRYGLPRLIFTVTGIVSMIPGAQAYQALVQISEGGLADGLTNAVRAGLVIGAIAAGLATARILTDVDWAKIEH